MFGISFSEIVLVAMIALIVVGPQKLPGLLLSLGRGIARIRKMTDSVRAQTGIDEILREEGIDGVRELRSLLRGEVAAARARTAGDMYDDSVEIDEAQEYPPEGPDAGGALADDLVASDAESAPQAEQGATPALPEGAPSEQSPPDKSPSEQGPSEPAGSGFPGDDAGTVPVKESEP